MSNHEILRGVLYGRVKKLRPLAYWLLDEESGTTAYDVSGNGYHGTYSGTWAKGQPGLGDGRKSIYSESAGYVNIYSAGLAAAANAALGSMLVWGKMTAAQWASASRYMFAFYTNGSNELNIRKGSTANRLSFLYKPGSVSTGRDIDVVGLLDRDDWFGAVLTWNKAADQVGCFLNGRFLGSGYVTGLGTWAGALPATGMNIATRFDTYSYKFNGYLAHCALWDRALTPYEAMQITKRWR